MTGPVTVWYLELESPAAFRPSGRQATFRLERLAPTQAALARWLYADVGGSWRWVDRLPWTVEQWSARLADPAVEIWVAVEGEEVAGYFELALRGDGGVELAYLGLRAHALGRGQGGPLLDAAIARAWAMGARRVFVNTCSLDHPAALPNYRARGFTVTRVERRAGPPARHE